MYQGDDKKVSEYRSKLSSMERDVNSLKSKYLFQDIFGRVRDIETKLSSIANSLKINRQKGFIFCKDWEDSIAAYREEMPGIKNNIQTESQNISNVHSFTLNSMLSEIASVRGSYENSPGSFYSHIDSLQSRILPVKTMVSDAQNKLSSMIQPMEEKVSKIKTRISRIDKGFENLEKASFKLLEGENLVDVWDAMYLKEGKKGPRGFIYLSDKRFRFEQDEDVVVSRKFLIVTKKKRVQKLMIDEPIGRIAASKDAEKGFFLARKEMLELEFGQGAKLRKATFRTFIDSKEIDDILDSVVSGGINAGKTAESIEKEKEKVKKPLPKIDKCPACGASFNTPIVKGMTHIKCNFCGKLVNF